MLKGKTHCDSCVARQRDFFVTSPADTTCHLHTQTDSRFTPDSDNLFSQWSRVLFSQSEKARIVTVVARHFGPLLNFVAQALTEGTEECKQIEFMAHKAEALDSPQHKQAILKLVEATLKKLSTQRGNMGGHRFVRADEVQALEHRTAALK